MIFMFFTIGVPIICFIGAFFKPLIFGPLLLIWLVINIGISIISDNKARKLKHKKQRLEEVESLFANLNGEDSSDRESFEIFYSHFFKLHFFDNRPRYSYKEGCVPPERDKLVHLGAETSEKTYCAEGNTEEEVKKKILELIEKDFTESIKAKKHETFFEMVERIIVEKGMKSTEFYKAADIDRKTYSAMRNNIKYQPKKETAIASCFGLKLDLKQSFILLSTAGYSLSSSIKRDVIIMYAINSKLTVDDANELLDAAGEKCLRNI